MRRLKVCRLLAGLAAILCAPGLAAAGPTGSATTAVTATASPATPNGPTDAGATADAAAVEAPPPEPVFATYLGLRSPIAFRVASAGKPPVDRAREASRALAAAIEREAAPAGPVASVDPEDGVLVVRVRGMVVTTLGPEDARAAGLNVPQYADQLEGQLESYVPAQLRRLSLQQFVLHVFVSVFMLVVGFVALRLWKRAFDRWDQALEQRTTFSALTLFRVPLFSTETLGGIMAFGLTVGRVVAYLLTVLAAVAGVLSQFPTTRPLLSQIATEGTQPLVRGAQAALGAIPGLLLATTLVIAVIAGLRVLHIVIDRAAAQRAGLRGIAPRRLPALRSALAAGIVLVFAPLVVAAMFGRFGTPIETLAVAAGVVALAASLPVLASSAAGAAIIWRQSLQEGDWIEVADLRGEVTQVNLHDIHLVPEQGGIAVIPTVFLLFHPIRKMREAPPATFEIEVARSRPPIELLARVTGAVKEVLPEAQLEIVELKTGALHLRLTVRGLRPDAKQRLFSSLAEAIERGDFELSLRATDSAS